MRKRNYKKKQPKTFVKKVLKIIENHEKTSVEHKYFDTSSDLPLLSSTSTTVDLTLVPQGDTDRQRDGDKLLPTLLEVNYWINGETYSSIFRIIIFRWLSDSQAGVPSVGNILHLANVDTSVISPYTHDQRGLFQVLYDKTHIVANNGNELIQVKHKMKLAKKPIDYANSTTAGSNKIYAMVMTDRILATSCVAKLRVRLHFTDS